MTVLISLLALFLPACPTEDSTNCYWDAATSGNNVGVSFVDINGTTYYTNK